MEGRRRRAEGGEGLKEKTEKEEDEGQATQGFSGKVCD
jgi:hypothetical protein